MRPQIGPLLAAGHLHQAIAALRQAGGAQPRVEEIHARLVALQREAVAVIPTTSQTADITAFVLDAERAVAGKPLLEALFVFAHDPPVPTVARLRETSEEHAKRYMLMSLFPKVFFSTEGKVVARQASLTSDDPSEREAALRMEMLASRLSIITQCHR